MVQLKERILVQTTNNHLGAEVATRLQRMDIDAVVCGGEKRCFAIKDRENNDLNPYFSLLFHQTLHHVLRTKLRPSCLSEKHFTD